jgi:hypothetical protein
MVMMTIFIKLFYFLHLQTDMYALLASYQQLKPLDEVWAFVGWVFVTINTVSCSSAGSVIYKHE